MKDHNVNLILYSCNKVPFKNKYLADKTLEKINARAGNSKRKITASYKCNICRKWHLTSMSQERHAAIVHCRKVRETTINPSQSYIQKRVDFLLSKNKMKR